MSSTNLVNQNKDQNIDESLKNTDTNKGNDKDNLANEAGFLKFRLNFSLWGELRLRKANLLKCYKRINQFKSTI